MSASSEPTSPPSSSSSSPLTFEEEHLVRTYIASYTEPTSSFARRRPRQAQRPGSGPGYWGADYTSSPHPEVVIAMLGPAGSGKSCLATRVAYKFWPGETYDPTDEGSHYVPLRLYPNSIVRLVFEGYLFDPERTLESTLHHEMVRADACILTYSLYRDNHGSENAAPAAALRDLYERFVKPGFEQDQQQQQQQQQGQDSDPSERKKLLWVAGTAADHARARGEDDEQERDVVRFCDEVGARHVRTSALTGEGCGEDDVRSMIGRILLRRIECEESGDDSGGRVFGTSRGNEAAWPVGNSRFMGRLWRAIRP